MLTTTSHFGISGGSVSLSRSWSNNNEMHKREGEWWVGSNKRRRVAASDDERRTNEREVEARGRGTGRGQREGKGVWVIGSKNINKNQQTKFYCFSNWVKTVVKRSKKHSPIFIEHVFISKLHFKTKNRKLTTIMTGALVSHAQLILNSNFDFIVLCILSVIGIPCFNRKITLDIRVTIWGMII